MRGISVPVGIEDIDAVKEQGRGMRASAVVDQFLWDAKYAIRRLRRNQSVSAHRRGVRL
jgi:hypothetical protein